MKKILPPPSLVKTWLDIQSQNILESVKVLPLKKLIYYFGTVEAALDYVEHHNY